jgi:hypothetical protein
VPGQFWSAHIGGGPPSPSAGAAYASSTTLTDVSPLPAITAGANFLGYDGATFHLIAYGTFSNTATPTLLLGFYYGGVAGTALGATSAITTTTGATNWPWRMEMTCTVRTTGSTGTIMRQGWIDLATSLTAVTHRPIPEVALATVTVDTTTAKILTVGAQWGTSNASNTLTCHGFTAMSLA